jgi:hypothetical protein
MVSTDLLIIFSTLTIMISCPVCQEESVNETGGHCNKEPGAVNDPDHFLVLYHRYPLKAVLYEEVGYIQNVGILGDGYGLPVHDIFHQFVLDPAAEFFQYG